jgi:hypothetical protein
MENHPIPQDVTGFQFKLIGNMTVKQFAYLMSGAILTGMLWQLPVNVLIKFPFCAFFAILGLGLAYFPISGRPMDTMIGNYIKAMINPTQFVYQKNGDQTYYPNKTSTTASGTRQGQNILSPFPKDKLKAYIESQNALPKNMLDEKENNFLTSVSNLATGSVVVNNESTVTPTANVDSQTLPTGYATIDSQKEAAVVPQPVPSLQPIQSTQPTTAPQPASPITRPQSQIENVKPLPIGTIKPIKMPSVPESPNIITGITKDPRGNALSNILVEIRDRENNPVRAFKTNEFGRFASATPLANGTYAIEFEDPRTQNRFEKIMVNVTGQIIMPIEAISVDAREELRKSLFATQTN